MGMRSIMDMLWKNQLESSRVLEELAQEIDRCYRKDHPYEQIVRVPYQGNDSLVTIQCRGCKGFREREATYEERELHSRKYSTIDL